MKLVYFTVPILTSATLLPDIANSDLLHKLTGNVDEKVNTNNETSICDEKTYKINNNEDLHKLKATCSQLRGELEVTAGFSDSILDLNSIYGIGGNLKIINCSALSMIKSNTLKSIAGDLILRNITTLKTIDLLNLQEVHSIDIRTLPMLNSFSISDIIGNKLDKLSVSDTALSDFSQISKISKVNVIDINNNRYLDKIGFNEMESIGDFFNMHGNGKNLEVEFPKLWTSGNFSVRDVQKISLPKLSQVNSSMDIHETFTTKIDIPELKKIGGSLAISNNNQLVNLKMDNLTDINGGLLIANNTKLDALGSFANLRTIGGGIHFEGLFNETKFSELKLVKGSAFINTSSSDFDCENWFGNDGSKTSIVRGGKYICSTGKKTTIGEVNDNGQVTDKKEYTGNAQSHSGSGGSSQHKDNKANTNGNTGGTKNSTAAESGAIKSHTVSEALIALLLAALAVFFQWV